MGTKNFGILKLASSAAASWAWGTGLIVGMEIAQTRGVGAWLIWAVCNSLTLALFGLLMKCGILNRRVMNSKPFKAFAIVIQVFCLLFQMTVINTVLCRLGCPPIASYAAASAVGVIFTLWMYKKGLPTSIKTDVVQYGIAIGGMALAAVVGVASGAEPAVRAVSSAPDILWGIWSGCVLLSGPIGDLQHWQRGELPNGPKAYLAAAGVFAVFLALDFLLSGFVFTPAMNAILIAIVLSVTSSTIDSIAVAMHELGGKKVGTAVLLAVCLGWGALVSVGVLSLWSHLGIPRVAFAVALVVGGIILKLRSKKEPEKDET